MRINDGRSKTMRALARAGVVAVVLGLSLGGASMAQAAETSTAQDSFVAELRTDGVPATEIEKFENLTPADQQRFIEVYSSDNPFAEAGVTFTEATTVTSTEPAVAAKVGGEFSTQDLWDVASNYRVNAEFLGIVLGYFNQDFYYVTGSGVVQDVKSCTGTWTGFSGFWSVSKNDSMWVQSGQGYCKTIFTGSVFYEGSNVQMNKEMMTITNGPGVVEKHLYNI
ncbi:hypothetical protein LXM50_14870 [Microbacterium sp. Au-Mic1]|uniref:hypothetical protein n=1 Tax=Microbacterium sp. Au-Mic1 TaxID=2906457 RepID=UPI001E3302D3|nr:hypothetical protein [Microbacterium sp. Au-Mic1]MCE4027255.1 hypothetical protein [Microbacterium sp. Au-Mic1]